MADSRRCSGSGATVWGAENGPFGVLCPQCRQSVPSHEATVFTDTNGFRTIALHDAPAEEAL